MKEIKRNALRCRKCDEVIESTHVHDFKFCRGGHVAVDGGRDYLRRVGDFSFETAEELSEYEDGPDS